MRAEMECSAEGHRGTEGRRGQLDMACPVAAARPPEGPVGGPDHQNATGNPRRGLVIEPAADT